MAGATLARAATPALLPMPYALNLENEVIVGEKRVRDAIRKVCYLD